MGFMNLKKKILLLAEISIKIMQLHIIIIILGNHKKHLISGVRVTGLRPQSSTWLRH